MTTIMQAIYRYIEEDYSREYLPRKHYRHCQHVQAEASQVLYASLSDEQRTLLETFLDTQTDCCRLERQAIFQAAWTAAQELLSPAASSSGTE